jgi:nicotinate phosphoribosyltransferase
MTKYSTLNLRHLDESVMEKPIVNSLLEDDFYEFSMGNFLYDHLAYRNADIELRFKNRTTGVLLADFISEDDFMKEFAYVRALKATKTDLHYLRGTNEYGKPMFSEPYLDVLSDLHVPEPTFSVTNDRQLDIRVKGKTIHTMHAEMPTLKITNALFYRSQLKPLSRMKRESIYAEGIQRLYRNIEKLKACPKAVVSDFGNRRAFNPVWHEFVVERCVEELESQFFGTSNVYLASKNGVTPSGTCGHIAQMLITALFFDGTEESIRKSIILMHEQWWAKYDEGLSITLPDTYGTKYTMSILPDWILKKWKGQRIDSMPPMDAIRYLIDLYSSKGINPQEKMVIPSDGLDVDSIINITNAFADLIRLSFGWGTKLTNDMGLQQLSIIMKLYSANGKFAVKLSDNIEKGMGETTTLASYKKALGYHETYAKACEV